MIEYGPPRCQDLLRSGSCIDPFGHCHFGHVCVDVCKEGMLVEIHYVDLERVVHTV